MNQDINKIKDILKRKITYYVYALVVIVVVLFFALPQVFEIWDKKAALAKVAEEFNKVETEGFTLQELKSEIPKIDSYSTKWIDKQRVEKTKKLAQEVYFQKLLSNIKPTFYGMFFSNSVWRYQDFLSKKTKELAEKKLSSDIVDRRESLNKVLPFYWDKTLTNWQIEWYYDDTDFILYIERIIEAFNLENSADIWISNLTSVDSEEGYNLDKFSSIDNWIYSFDINLELIWAKEDILDFIYYVENVWNIEVSWDTIEIKNDRYIRNRIPWDREPNIYAHPIMEIKNISMPEYIDNSIDVREKQTLFNFVKSTKPREEFETDISVTFFVRWQPEYKKEEFIKLTFEKYNELKAKTTKQLAIINSRGFIQKTDKAVIFRRDTQKILNYLDAINKDISSDFKNSKKPGNINWMYKKFEDYAEVFDNLEWILDDVEEWINLVNWK